MNEDLKAKRDEILKELNRSCFTKRPIFADFILTEHEEESMLELQYKGFSITVVCILGRSLKEIEIIIDYLITGFKRGIVYGMLNKQ